MEYCHELTALSVPTAARGTLEEALIAYPISFLRYIGYPGPVRQSPCSTYVDRILSRPATWLVILPI